MKDYYRGDEQIKHIANTITIGRILGSFLLLMTMPLSIPFFVIYALCCISDVLDGYIARKTKTASKFGEHIDSIADFVFAAVLLYIMFPLLSLEPWMYWWIGIIAFVRIMSLVIGGLKYRAFSFLHTYANKITGVVLAGFPVMLRLAGLSATTVLLCGIASLSALEELLITVKSKQLNRNIPSIFPTAYRATDMQDSI